VIFHISAEKNGKDAKNDISLQQYAPIATKFGVMALNMSLKCTVVKNSHFKNPRWRTAAILTKNATSHNDEERVSQTYRPSAILDFDFLTARALERCSASSCQILWRSV